MKPHENVFCWVVTGTQEGMDEIAYVVVLGVFVGDHAEDRARQYKAEAEKAVRREETICNETGVGEAVQERWRQDTWSYVDLYRYRLNEVEPTRIDETDGQVTALPNGHTQSWHFRVITECPGLEDTQPCTVINELPSRASADPRDHAPCVAPEDQDFSRVPKVD